MKTKLLLTLIGIISVFSLTTHLNAQTFSYSYNTPFDSNATEYIVQETNVMRDDEYPSGGSAHWEANATYTNGIIVQDFNFGFTPTSINLVFDLYTNETVNEGQAEMDASTNGVNWTVLAFVPFGSTPGTNYYDMNLPSNLLGTNLWLQATMITDGPASYDSHFAQFSRSPSPELDPTTPVFSVYATVPEPSAYFLILMGFVPIYFARKASRRVTLRS